MNVTRRDSDFGKKVIERSGTDINRCLHCRCCGGGCPFIAAMDHPPNNIIRLVQLGMKKQALESSTIWSCVGCHTCSIQCPMAIDIAAFMDVLRGLAIEEGAKIAEPDILGFHQEVLGSIRRYGRTHKLEIMLRYKLKTRDFFGDMNVGLKMLARRKLDLLPSKVKAMAEIRKAFERGKSRALQIVAEKGENP